MLAIVPSATLHGLDGRFIRVEVDVAPGSARASRSSGWPTPRSRRPANGSAAPCATPGSSIHRAGSRSTSRRPTSARPARRSTSRWPSGSCSARSRSRPGRGAWRSSASCRSAARCGPCRASCRWSPSWRGAVCDGSWSPPPRSTRRGSSTGSRWSASRRCSMRSRSSGRDEPDASRRRRDGSSWSRRSGRAGRRRRGCGVSPGPPLPPVRTCARSAARSRRGAGSRSRWPAVTACCSSGRPGRARRCWLGRSPGCCRRSTMRAALAATVVASAAGEGPIAELRRRPPFRSPHHTISYAGMVGGGPNLSPGEVTRADQGVLFLDELPEFGRDVLEALRQPMEEGRVAVSRVGRATIFPARFQLVAAMNPCPCGFAGSSDRACGCPPHVPERYQRRVSGPLRDRIDLWISMPRVAPLALVRGPEPEGSAVVGARIAAARRVALGRPSGHAQRPAERTRAARRLPARSRHGAAHRPARRPGTRQRPRHRTPAAGRADDRGSRRGGRRRRGAPRRGGLVPAGRHAARRRRGRLTCSV